MIGITILIPFTRTRGSMSGQPAANIASSFWPLWPHRTAKTPGTWVQQVGMPLPMLKKCVNKPTVARVVGVNSREDAEGRKQPSKLRAEGQRRALVSASLHPCQWSLTTASLDHVNAGG